MNKILLVIVSLLFVACSKESTYNMLNNLQKNKEKHEANEAGLIYENNKKPMSYKEYKEELKK